MVGRFREVLLYIYIYIYNKPEQLVSQVGTWADVKYSHDKKIAGKWVLPLSPARWPRVGLVPASRYQQQGVGVNPVY